ncbi:hypothetical protein V8G54_025696 [Vigna mungo]|uniref:Uncharacterized protein n=1 Tax=Vigna mungo TaxID=3915 RepID=A0AAQ3RMI2_VIGMU
MSIELWLKFASKKVSIYTQESSYPSSSTTSFYKSGLSEPGSTSYYQDSNGYEVNYHEQLMDEYRRHSENSATINEQMATIRIEREEGVNNVSLDSSTECKLESSIT